MFSVNVAIEGKGLCAISTALSQDILTKIIVRRTRATHLSLQLAVARLK